MQLWNAEYRSGMGIGLGLELGSGVRVRSWAGVLFCSSIAQFLAILHILHCVDVECIWR